MHELMNIPSRLTDLRSILARERVRRAGGGGPRGAQYRIRRRDLRRADGAESTLRTRQTRGQRKGLGSALRSIECHSPFWIWSHHQEEGLRGTVSLILVHFL
jgi:hypothetical protein